MPDAWRPWCFVIDSGAAHGLTMAPVPSFALDARERGCALGIVRPEQRCHRRWLDHPCLEHLAAGARTSLRLPWPFPISRACSRPRMTPALRGRRSSSFPSHSRPDLGQPCAAAPRSGATARVNGIARPSRNGRCQSSRRWGASSRCRSGTVPEVTPPGLPRVP